MLYVNNSTCQKKDPFLQAAIRASPAMRDRMLEPRMAKGVTFARIVAPDVVIPAATPPIDVLSDAAVSAPPKNSKVSPIPVTHSG